MKTAFELAEEPAQYLLPLIRKGLPASSLEQMAVALGLTKSLLAEKLRIAKRTLARKESAHLALSADESEKVMRVARIRNLARSLFNSDEGISQWLMKPDAALGNRAPLDFLDTELGAREVEDLIQSIAYGQFV